MKNGSRVQLRYLNMKNNNTPDIRFPGFTDGWEQRKLSSICSMHARIGWQNLRTSEFLDTGKYYLVTGTDFDDGKVNLSTCHYVEKERYDQDKKIQIKNGSILITKDGTLGKVALVEGLDKPATLNAGVFNVEIVAENIDNKYLFQYLKAPFLMDYVDRKATGGTIKHLNQNILVDFPVWLSDYEEQKRVGLFFQQLDRLITFHQNGLDILKKTKKGFLQKMFPKEGESVPEIRFPGFTHDWEQRELSELSNKTFGGGTPSTKIKEYWNGDIPWIQSSDLQTDSLSNVFPTKQITAEAVSKSATKLIPKNSIAIVTRVGVGKLALMPYSYTTSQDFLSLSDLNVSLWFGTYCIYNLMKREINNIQGTSIKGITKDALLSKRIKVPYDKDEQERIGALFKQLDDTIALHQRELESLKETKKAFLQKMFINT